MVTHEEYEKTIIWDYHERYRHMGVEKVVKQALQEHIYIKGIKKKVKRPIKQCEICQKVKVANIKREGEMIAILADERLEKVCGPLPQSGGVQR